MPTELVTVDPWQPEPERIARAAAVLRRGGLVCFPTETVYGLGANALDAAAAAKIFQAKGRPASNPLIVHVASLEAAQTLADSWPAAAQALAESFWPGSLTLVVPKKTHIPDIVTAGGPTVALRIPAHPVALALLRAAALPIAAPSANRSNHLSPTRAEHVVQDLGGRVDLILDGGPCPGGLESTVLDVAALPPRLLRPGLITPAQLEVVVGPIQRAEAVQISSTAEPLRSPGMLSKHYAPRASLECVPGCGWPHVQEWLRQGKKVGWLRLTPGPEAACPELAVRIMPAAAKEYAAALYAVLHQLDDAGVERIIVDLPPETEEWLAIQDRLRRASGLDE